MHLRKRVRLFLSWSRHWTLPGERFISKKRLPAENANFWRIRTVHVQTQLQDAQRKVDLLGSFTSDRALKDYERHRKKEAAKGNVKLDKPITMQIVSPVSPEWSKSKGDHERNVRSDDGGDGRDERSIARIRTCKTTYDQSCRPPNLSRPPLNRIGIQLALQTLSCV